MADPSALETWVSLNSAVRDMNETDCQELLGLELNGKNRKQFVLRLHSRLNRVRADREREELLEGRLVDGRS